VLGRQIEAGDAKRDTPAPLETTIEECATAPLNTLDQARAMVAAVLDGKLLVAGEPAASKGTHAARAGTTYGEVAKLWTSGELPTLLAVAFALSFAITRAFRRTLEPALVPPDVPSGRQSRALRRRAVRLADDAAAAWLSADVSPTWRERAAIRVHAAQARSLLPDRSMSSAGVISARPPDDTTADARGGGTPVGAVTPEKRRPTASAIAVLAILALAHTPLPWALAWLGHHGGIQTVELAALGLHLFGPLIYLPVYRRVQLSWRQWALVLGINHVFVLLGALPYGPRIRPRARRARSRPRRPPDRPRVTSVCRLSSPLNTDRLRASRAQRRYARLCARGATCAVDALPAL
jgi:hypothetical protein